MRAVCQFPYGRDGEYQILTCAAALCLSLVCTTTCTTYNASRTPVGNDSIRPAQYTAMKVRLADQAHKLTGRALHPIEVEADEFWKETLETLDSDKAVQLSEADQFACAIEATKVTEATDPAPAKVHIVKFY